MDHYYNFAAPRTVLVYISSLHSISNQRQPERMFWDAAMEMHNYAIENVMLIEVNIFTSIHFLCLATPVSFTPF